jgi:anti-sigma regulatory factor (Ser/Thr protein kinase)
MKPEKRVMSSRKKAGSGKSRKEETVGQRRTVKVCRYSLEPSPSSLTTLREFIRVTLRPYPNVEPHIEDIVSATHEACKNSLLHNPRSESPVDVICKVLKNSVVIEVLDKGSGFDPEILPPSPPEPEAQEGRGLLIIYSLMDKVEAETGERGTRIRMHKRLRPAAQAQG